MKVVIFLMSLVLVAETYKFIPLNCYRPAQYGSCKGSRRMWAYTQYEHKCFPFTYSGCGGNPNRFYTKERCEKICRHE